MARWRGGSSAWAAARAQIPTEINPLLIAIDGGWGTISEIAHALRNDTPVITLKTPSIDLPHGRRLTACSSVEDALAQMDRLISSLSK